MQHDVGYLICYIGQNMKYEIWNARFQKQICEISLDLKHPDFKTWIEHVYLHKTLRRKTLSLVIGTLGDAS